MGRKTEACSRSQLEKRRAGLRMDPKVSALLGRLPGALGLRRAKAEQTRKVRLPGTGAVGRVMKATGQGCLAGAPQHSTCFVFPLFKQHSHPTCDNTKANPGANPSQGDRTTTAHVSCVIGASTALATSQLGCTETFRALCESERFRSLQ